MPLRFPSPKPRSVSPFGGPSSSERHFAAPVLAQLRSEVASSRLQNELDAARREVEFELLRSEHEDAEEAVNAEARELEAVKAELASSKGSQQRVEILEEQVAIVEEKWLLATEKLAVRSVHEHALLDRILDLSKPKVLCHRGCALVISNGVHAVPLAWALWRLATSLSQKLDTQSRSLTSRASRFSSHLALRAWRGAASRASRVAHIGACWNARDVRLLQQAALVSWLCVVSDQKGRLRRLSASTGFSARIARCFWSLTDTASVTDPMAHAFFLHAAFAAWVHAVAVTYTETLAVALCAKPGWATVSALMKFWDRQFGLQMCSFAWLAWVCAQRLTLEEGDRLEELSHVERQGTQDSDAQRTVATTRIEACTSSAAVIQLWDRSLASQVCWGAWLCWASTTQRAREKRQHVVDVHRRCAMVASRLEAQAVLDTAQGAWALWMLARWRDDRPKKDENSVRTNFVVLLQDMSAQRVSLFRLKFFWQSWKMLVALETGARRHRIRRASLGELLVGACDVQRCVARVLLHFVVWREFARLRTVISALMQHWEAQLLRRVAHAWWFSMGKKRQQCRLASCSRRVQHLCLLTLWFSWMFAVHVQERQRQAVAKRDALVFSTSLAFATLHCSFIFRNWRGWVRFVHHRRQLRKTVAVTAELLLVFHRRLAQSLSTQCLVLAVPGGMARSVCTGVRAQRGDSCGRRSSTRSSRQGYYWRAIFR